MKNRTSKSVLFLMELMLIILFFSLCSSVCLKIFAGAKKASDYSNDLNNACVLARSGAECYKAFDGNLNKVSKELGGYIKNNRVIVKGELYLYIEESMNDVNIYVSKSSNGDIDNSIFTLKLRREGK